jgi:hypothetical protein
VNGNFDMKKISKRNQRLELKSSDSLFRDLRSLIIEARQDVARQVNSALVLLYWRVGRRIRKDILKGIRADYGEQIVATLS